MRDGLPTTISVIDSAIDGVSLPLIEGKGTAKAVLWPGNGAKYRTVHLLELVAGDTTVDLKHGSDAVYYVAAGKGEIVDIAADFRSELIEGSMVHIDSGDPYRFETRDGMKLLGGPCPADFSLYSNLGLTSSD